MRGFEFWRRCDRHCWIGICAVFVATLWRCNPQESQRKLQIPIQPTLHYSVAEIRMHIFASDAIAQSQVSVHEQRIVSCEAKHNA